MLSKTSTLVVLHVIYFASLSYAQNSFHSPKFKQQVIDTVEQALRGQSASGTENADKSLADVRLIDIDLNVQKKEVTLNFSQELLNFNLGNELEHVLDHILNSVGNVTQGLSEVHYTILIEGVQLQEFFTFPPI